MKFKVPEMEEEAITITTNERMQAYCNRVPSNGCLRFNCRECIFGNFEDDWKDEREKAFLKWEAENKQGEIK